MNAHATATLLSLGACLLVTACAEPSADQRPLADEAGAAGQADTRYAASPEAAARADRVEASLRPTVLIEGQDEQPLALADRMYLHGVPGVSVAVLRDGELDWARAYGVADVGTGRAVTTETLFQGASISKPVAAMAALRLVEEEGLHLDGDVNGTLRSWSIPESEFLVDQPVTLRGLLTHTAGLSVSGFPGYRADAAIPTAIQVLNGEGPTNTDPVESVAAPGSEWGYSGGGYTVLQVLVEDVANQPFASVVQSSVLDPIGMDRSFFGLELSPEQEGDAAFGHRPDGSAVPGRWHRYPELAAAGLWTTPTDLLKWSTEVLESAAGRSDRVLSPAMTRQMLEPGMGDWGLGPEISGDGTRFLHTGSNQGYRCLLAVANDGSVGVAVMTNSDNGSVLMAEIAYAVAQVYQWEGEGLAPQVRTTVPIDPAVAEGFAGTYPAPGDRQVVVTVEDGQLTAASEWFRKQALYAESDDTFFLIHGGTRLRFVEEDGEMVLELFGMRLPRE